MYKTFRYVKKESGTAEGDSGREKERKEGFEKKKGEGRTKNRVSSGLFAIGRGVLGLKVKHKEREKGFGEDHAHGEGGREEICGGRFSDLRIPVEKKNTFSRQGRVGCEKKRGLKEKRAKS